jgi:hypothetical protein
MQITKESAVLNIREALKKISQNGGGGTSKECWFDLIQRSIKVAGEDIDKEGDLHEIWEELGHNKYIMSQIIERSMRHHVTKGFKNV